MYDAINSIIWIKYQIFLSYDYGSWFLYVIHLNIYYYSGLVNNLNSLSIIVLYSF